MPGEVARFQMHASVHGGVQLGHVFIWAALVQIYTVITVNGSYCCSQQDFQHLESYKLLMRVQHE